MPSYAVDISKFVEKTGLKLGLIMRKLAMQALRGVVMKTPVLTGRLRGNWRVGLNVIDLTTDWLLKDKVGQNTIARGEAIINLSTGRDAKGRFTQKMTDLAIFITNNLPYALKIEDGGSPVKAPEGMLKITFQEVVIGLQVAVDSVRNM